jgi:hypothetical protein
MFLAVWPVGIPLLYAALLWASREAIISGVPTPLSRATSFLTSDCISAGIRTTAILHVRRRLTGARIHVRIDRVGAAYWWEPLEMCRKLALTGWVILIHQESRLARVLVAILVSIVCCALHLAIKPFERYVAPTPRLHANEILCSRVACASDSRTES